MKGPASKFHVRKQIVDARVAKGIMIAFITNIH